MYVTGLHRLTVQWYITFIILRTEQNRRVDAVPMRFLKKLLGISRCDHIRSEEIREKLWTTSTLEHTHNYQMWMKSITTDCQRKSTSHCPLGRPGA